MARANLAPRARTARVGIRPRVRHDRPVAPREVLSSVFAHLHELPAERVELLKTMLLDVAAFEDQPFASDRVPQVRAHVHNLRVNIRQLSVRDDVVAEVRHAQISLTT